MTWLFGYGSLIWKVDFPYKQKLVGYINGYTRRFYYYSTDHRGTEENPGRVVTLLPSLHLEDQVWGVAFEVLDEDDNVWEQLDRREKNGYVKKVIKFYPEDDTLRPFDIVVYIGDQSSKWYAGEASIEDIAQCIAVSKGQSGYNLEYLCQLADSMRNIAPHIQDKHLYALETKTLNIISNRNKELE